MSISSVAIIDPGVGFDGTFLIGPGTDDNTPVSTPAAGQEVAASYWGPLYPAEMDFGRFGRFLGRVPLSHLRAMACTPAVSSSIDALVAAALSGGISLTCSVRPPDNPDAPPDPLLEKAELALRQCRDSMAHLEFTTPVAEHLREMMRAALLEGYKLAEPVMEPDTAHAGAYRIARVKSKPRWSHRFEVDGAFNVPFVKTYTVQNEWKKIRSDHFSWLTWDGRDGDPRGVDCVHPAYLAWSELVQAVPYLGKYIKHFAVPMLWGTPGPGDGMVTPRDAKGQPIPGAPPVTPQRAQSVGMQQMEGGAKVAGTHGSDIKVVETSHDGSGLYNGIAILEAWIVKTILLQVRATTEAKHGSKADSETGQDILGTLVRFVRSWACAYWRGVLGKLVLANFGPEVAEAITPHVSLGKIEPQDFAAFAAAIAVLYQAGYFTEGQLPELDALMSLAVRHKGDPRVGPQKDNAGAPDGPTQVPTKGVAA